MREREKREETARAFARQIDVDPDQLVAAADAVWSNLNPDRTPYDRALSVAGVALSAAKKAAR